MAAADTDERRGVLPGSQANQNTSANPDFCEGLGALNLRHVIGFQGDIHNGLIVHPLGKHVIYAVGSHVVIEEIAGKKLGVQELLMGHTDKVTCIAVSHEGQYLASGQKTTREFKSLVILWDWCSRRKVMEYPLHMGDTKAVEFLHSSYFVTLGGCDDLTVAVWSTEDRKPLKREDGQIKRARPALCIATSSYDPGLFVTAGERYGRIWRFSVETKNLTSTELQFGPSTRKVITVKIADLDKASFPLIFCGTSSGTVLVFHGKTGTLQLEIPAKNPFPLGVTCLEYVRMLDDENYCFLLGTGEGKVGYYVIRMCNNARKQVEGKLSLYKGTKLWKDERNNSAVTSISKVGPGHMFYVGTEHGHIYRFKLEAWTSELVRTCTHKQVYAIAFPRATDELLVTGEFGMVRVYNLKVMLEARRFEFHNRTCTSLVLNHDGTQIFSGWDTGDILVLGFDPRGLLLCELFRINHTQKQMITAMCLTSTSHILLTGGKDALCTSWRLVDDLDQRGRRLRQGVLMKQFTDQRGPITCMQMFQDDRRCAVSSEDGSATVYDIELATRLTSVRLECALTALALCADDLQFVTASQNGRLQWWEVLNGASVRETDACKTGSILAIAMEPTRRQAFITGGDDRLIKFWSMAQGTVTHVGRGHSHPVTKVVFGPCGTVLVSAGKEGALFIWDMQPAC